MKGERLFLSRHEALKGLFYASSGVAVERYVSAGIKAYNAMGTQNAEPSNVSQSTGGKPTVNNGEIGTAQGDSKTLGFLDTALKVAKEDVLIGVGANAVAFAVTSFDKD